jgi:hypothetical protein
MQHTSARQRKNDDRRSGLATDLQVGECLTFRAPHGTGELRFSVDAKEVGTFFAGDALVDSVEITLIIERKQGQLARVRVQAPRTVQVGLPKADRGA